jgi:hypothetical protein
MKSKPLTGPAAASQFQQDPFSISFPIGSFLTQFGLTPDEFRSEAASGRLVASATAAKPNTFNNVGRRIVYHDLHVTAGHLLLWLSNPDTPKYLVERIDSIMSGKSVRQ